MPLQEDIPYYPSQDFWEKNLLLGTGHLSLALFYPSQGQAHRRQDRQSTEDNDKQRITGIFNAGIAH